MPGKDVNHRAADRFARFVDSRGGLILLGAWAFFEPSFWFIAPDVLLWLMCMLSRGKFIKYFLVTLLSALAGAAFYFLLNLYFFDSLQGILMATPFINDGMILRIENILAVHGLKGLLFQAFSFMSLKIWVHLAVQNDLPFHWFMLLTGISRALRFFLFALLFSRIGSRFDDLLKRYFIPFVALYVIGFILILVVMETSLTLG